MFQQRPMPPMNSRGYFPQQGQIPMGRQANPGSFMGRGQLGLQMAARGAGGGGGLKGILSKILPGSQGAAGGGINPQSFIGGANAASNATRATGSLQGLMNPSNISGMLGNVQRVLGMAQQVTPMVQQYGPLVKNLPAMVKIYRELNSSNDNGSNDSTNETTQAATVTEQSNQSTKQNVGKKTTKKESPSKSEEVMQSTETKKRKPTPRSSQPKMYI
ncbi:YqfQ family protein [Metabacillus litoralis]|uniref:YqfQ family protein n=1 Tax=Metabacillus litoralis TaxID=152268 RepID=UPI000EF5BC1C|nr:YqfQ family protein [Metabacillus litoralis]